MDKEIAVTVEIPENIYNKLVEIKEKTGISLKFQINKMIKKGIENENNKNI